MSTNHFVSITCALPLWGELVNIGTSVAGQALASNLLFVNVFNYYIGLLSFDRSECTFCCCFIKTSVEKNEPCCVCVFYMPQF